MRSPASARRQGVDPSWLDGALLVVALLLGSLSALVLVGWELDIRVLSGWIPGFPPMKANAALGVMLAGAALLATRSDGREARMFGTAAAWAVLVIGGATIFQYASGRDLHIDELLVRDHVTSGPHAAGRMAILAAAALVLAAINLLLIRRPVTLATTLLPHGVGIAALPALLGHAYNLEALQPSPLPGIPMAFNASVLLIVLAFGLSIAQPASVMRRLLSSQGPGGLLLRRLLPVAVVLPFVTGSALLRLHETGFLGHTATIAIFAAVNIIVLGALVLWTAAVVERAESTRSRLAAIVESSSDAIISTDLQGQVTSWNAGAEALYGYMSAEIIGRPVRLIVPPSLYDDTLALRVRASGGEAISNRETTRLRKDGSRIDVSLAMFPVRDASGTIIGLSTIARDISERKRLERAAREAESRFRALVEQAIVGVYVIAEGRFAYVNRKMADMFGYTPEEMLAMPSVMEIVDPANRETVTENMRTRLVTGSAIEYEAAGRRKDGSLIHLEVHGGVIDDGGRRQLLGVTLDVTDRKQAREALAISEARLTEAQSVAHVGSWELDLRTNTLHWSDEVYRIFGVEPQSFGATYEYFLERIHPEDRDQVNAAYSRSVATGTPYSIDHRIVLADGTLKHVHERCVTHYNAEGTAERSIGTVQDITDRKLAEEALSRLNDELESRVEQRTAELHAANKELEAFSYSVSHDLRAPLRALQGFSRILLEEHMKDLAPEAARYVGIIRDNAAQMGELIDDLLSFSRLSRQPLQAVPVDMRAVVFQALEQLAVDRAGRQVSIRCADLPPCLGDPALLRQVLVNLLSNALKFTRQRDDAVIEVGAAPGHAGEREHVYFVRDNGAGFDMQYRDKLFGIFQRLHPVAEYEGTGVGLAIVQRIIQRHGGRVWPEAAPGSGATFYFSVPKDW